MAKSLPLHSQCIGMQIRNMFLIPISITLKAGDSWSVVISFLFQQKNRKKKGNQMSVKDTAISGSVISFLIAYLTT